MPARKKQYIELHKQELKRMKAEIEKAWEALEQDHQRPIDFTVHQGERFVGRSPQPKTGT
jgi:hypothetical protein